MACKTSDHKRWRARVRIDGKHFFLGNFSSKEEAEKVEKEYLLLHPRKGNGDKFDNRISAR